MIRQSIDINGYWKVIVYYNVNYNLFAYITNDLLDINISSKTINRIYKNLVSKKAKAVTISNIDLKTSIVLFNTHKNKYDYISSIVHEAEHIKQAMLKAYNVPDKDEAPAYTIGFLVMKMLEKKILNMLGLKNS
jgi:hypothetical protein